MTERKVVLAGEIAALHPPERTGYIRRLGVRLQRLQDEIELEQEQRDLLEAVGQVLLYDVGLGEIATEPL